MIVLSIGINAEEYSGECGENLTWNLDTSTGILDITGFGDMTKYSKQGAPWRFYNKYIKNVHIGDNVTSIGDYAFWGYHSLISIRIGESVTSIGKQSFDACDNLTEISIPASLKSMGWCAFDDCTSLTGVYITDIAAWCGISFDIGSNPLEHAKMLYLNGELVTDLVISDSVTSIGKYTFYHCNSLTSVSIGDSVTSIGFNAFAGCDSLTSVSISASVTSIPDNYAFSDCKSLTSISVDKNNQYYSSDEYGILYDKNKTMLIQCPAANPISDFVIPDSVINIGDDAFYNCQSLSSVNIGDSVTSIGEKAFYGCQALSNVSIGDLVTSIGRYAFENTAYYKNAANWGNKVLYIGKYLIEGDHSGSDFHSYYSIKEGTSVIADYAFEDIIELTKIDIPDSVISIGKNAFSYCFLVNVDIPDSVTSIGARAFGDCAYLKTVTLSKNITKIENNTFFACYKLKNIVIPDGVTTIEYRAFIACENLESVYIPSSVSLIGEEAFKYCPKLTIKCYENSYAHQYAIENGIPYQLLNSTVTERGMQFRIENLESVKSIRYAYGDYDTEKDIKYGTDSVSHSGKTLRNKGDSCTLQFTKPGLVSIVITYNDGSRDFYKYEVTKTKPTVSRNGNEVTFGNLDNLKVLRYVKGEYNSSYDIKRAEGSVAISGKTLTSDTYTVTLEPGTYTFCVQYNDESYNYYTFVVTSST